MQFVHNILTQYWIRTLFKSELLALCAAHLIFCQKRAVFLSPVSSNLPPLDSGNLLWGGPPAFTLWVCHACSMADYITKFSTCYSDKSMQCPCALQALHHLSATCLFIKLKVL